MIELQRIEPTLRSPDGTPIAWIYKGVIARFTSLTDLAAYAVEHRDELDENVAAFSGSASTIMLARQVLAEARKGVNVYV